MKIIWASLVLIFLLKAKSGDPFCPIYDVSDAKMGKNGVCAHEYIGKLFLAKCNENLVCEHFKLNEDSVCKQIEKGKTLAGENCKEDNDCASKSCKSGKCVGKNEGSPCNSTSECGPEAYCKKDKDNDKGNCASSNNQCDKDGLGCPTNKFC